MNQTGYKNWKNAPERSTSMEVDFGVHWREKGKRHPTYRVSWIKQTGELYAKTQAYREAGDRFEVFGIFKTREEVERVMDGWAEQDDMVLDWIRERAGIVV